MTTGWENQTNRNHAELAGLVNRSGEATQTLMHSGMGMEQARTTLDQMLQGQSVMLAPNQIFFWSALAFIFAASVIWFAPKPTRVADTSSAH